MARASPRPPGRALTISLSVATLLALTLAACASQPAFVAADYAKCRELGFQDGSRDYAICLTEVQKRRNTLAAAPEPIVE